MRLVFDAELADKLVELPLGCIGREYPNKLDHHLSGLQDVRGPRELHPAFYGCYDWHSAVHSHWTLIALLKRFRLAKADEIRGAIWRTMSRENLLAEAEYLDQPNRESFERMYGWAWLLKLATELRDWEDPDGQEWAQNLRPVEERIVERYLRFLPKQRYPIRSGVHFNTAFGLTFALDYARYTENAFLEDLVETTALGYYERDAACSVAFEPGGNDFLSPALVEAELMANILGPGEFGFCRWFDRFLPDLAPILEPAVVDDRVDPQIGHLDGLNLSRAWCLDRIAYFLPTTHRLRGTLKEAADRHAAVGLASFQTGNYMGEHWLASFALYFLLRRAYWESEPDLWSDS